MAPVRNSMPLPHRPDAIAPDGSTVRVLLATDRGSMAHFELAPGDVSVPAHHRSVDELWYFVGGTGTMWLRDARDDETTEEIAVHAGVCVRIPCGTHFQFACHGTEPLQIVGVTMPPWPGDGEAIRSTGDWQPPTLDPGPGLADD